MDVCEREKSHEAPRRDGPELREGKKKGRGSSKIYIRHCSFVLVYYVGTSTDREDTVKSPRTVRVWRATEEGIINSVVLSFLPQTIATVQHTISNESTKPPCILFCARNQFRSTGEGKLPEKKK